jgi:ATP-dependent RNA helicase RhlE
MLKFEDLELNPTILKNLSNKGYLSPTPIQAEAIPHLLEGRDLLGIAQTGTGKTAAFSLPILNYLSKNHSKLHPGEPRVLILAPTRELASQIKDNITLYSKDLNLATAVIYGGVGQANQVNALRKGLDILVATPGRLLDLMNQGHAKLNRVEIFVLDEADRMLDMGFINDIKKVIAKLPEKRQTLLFSATMPNEIATLANRLLKSPKKVEVTPPSTTVERIDQRVILCRKVDKYQLLRKLIQQEDTELVLVFTRTKHGANKIVEYLANYKIPSAAIHGNKSQSAREAALNNFKSGTIKVLIATDIAARGIDVQGVTHVINYDLPVDAESYVHRIGRTARAGKEGDAISFCDETERDALARIQKLIKLKLSTENFIAEPEAAFKPSRPHRDPRSIRKPEKNVNQSEKNKKETDQKKVGFKFRNRR